MSDLRVALRINADAGNSRRELDQLNRNLRRAGREGAAGLNREAVRAGASLVGAGRKGAAAFRETRGAMRNAATDGSAAFKQASREMTTALERVTQELRELRQVGSDGAREISRDFQRAEREGVQEMRESVDRTNGSFRRLARTGGRELGTLKRLAAGVRGEFDRLRNVTGGMGTMLGVGVGTYVVGAQMKQVALRQRGMLRTQQTAGMSVEQRETAHDRLWQISRAYGVDRSQMDVGLNTLIASGVNHESALASMDAIGQAAAVSGADAGILAKSLVAAANAYDIDLSQPEAALDLLQKMLVAGRLGNAELENLADIFPKIGAKAKAAGMSFSEALAYIETLSTTELDPSRLGTLAESALRIFSNKGYMEQITEETGIEYFKADGSWRSKADILGDLKGQFDQLGTEQERNEWFGRVFKGMDLDTVRGNRVFLSGDNLDTYVSHAKTTEGAEDVIQSDLKANVESASGTAGRMRATLGQAMDEMMRPINAALADAGSYLLDDLGLSGQELLAAGLGGGAALYAGARGAGALGGKLFGGAGVLGNIAVGTALEEATGVNAVYVTNWPARMGLGGPRGGGDIDAPGGKRSRTRTAGRPGTSPAGGGWRTPLKNAGRFTKFAAPLTLALGATDALQIANNDSLSADERAIEQAKNTGETGGALVGAALGFAFGGPPGALLGGVAGHFGGGELGERLPGWLAPAGEALDDWLPSWLGGGDDTAQARLAAPSIGDGVPPMLRKPGATGPGSPMGASATLAATEARLRELLAKPLVIEIRGDTEWLTADVERRVGIQTRRGQ